MLLLQKGFPGADVMRVSPPGAADALRLAAARVRSGDFDDVALLDGHYLRRSDAEIFGDKQTAA